MKNKRENIIDGIISVVACLIAFGLGYWTGCMHNKHKSDIPTPVEKEVIDTLYITRDNYINSIKYLDSIKYDTIQKVYDLNDSATFLLFLQLVSK